MMKRSSPPCFGSTTTTQRLYYVTFRFKTRMSLLTFPKAFWKAKTLLRGCAAIRITGCCTTGRLFPHQSSVHSQEWKRLAKEVLEPLTNYYNLGGIVGHKRRDDKKYLEEIAAGNLSGIKYDALLPHQIILYAEDGSDIKQAAELQWKTKVEGMHLKGKFRNYFAVYHTTKYADKGVGGRMMQDQPLLCPIQGKDLKYKCEFMGTMESDLFVDYEKLFDIPEVTAIAKGSVKPEQMIKTVFVFSESLRFSGIDESQYVNKEKV
ncbi:hypothetical protein ACFX16_015904 [Malus domestica]